MKLKELLLVVHLLVGFHFILHAQNHLVVYPAPDEVDLKRILQLKSAKWERVAMGGRLSGESR